MTVLDRVADKGICTVKAHIPSFFAYFKVGLDWFYPCIAFYRVLDRICHSNRELLYHPKNITKRLVVVHAKRLAGQQLFLPERFCIYDLMIRKRF